MLRLTVCLAVFASIFAATTEVEAQRRTPIRNLLKRSGIGWGAGNHWRNPGHNSGYYNPYASDFHNGQSWQQMPHQQINGDSPQFQDGQIIEAPGTMKATPTPTQNFAPPAEENSASRLLNNRTTYSTGHSINHSISDQYQGQIQHPTNSGTTATVSDQAQIHQHLRPYHNRTQSDSAVQIRKGGDFQIKPSTIPTHISGWRGHIQDTAPVRNGGR